MTSLDKRFASSRRFDVFTDGACLGNPGPGGWGVILRWRGIEKELSGGVAETTNNRMELTAAIEGFAALKRGVPVRVTTDSTYLRDGVTRWLPRWQQNGWRTADRKPVKNADLWQRLGALIADHRVEWLWVRGHSGHAENERADRLARIAAESARDGLRENGRMLP
jgi:ribonuclease HI